jgi:hypothetical protein
MKKFRDLGLIQFHLSLNPEEEGLECLVISNIQGDYATALLNAGEQAASAISCAISSG